ncbi:ABC transporter ATP-binding protein [Cytobacillus pseudoceanisediminis]|uniref:ABC transporter ATP-binding protein n=1 Tax=Cytobacillus pseudoceanisediminis TaxID=3051614 RepID=UPI00365436E7
MKNYFTLNSNLTKSYFWIISFLGKYKGGFIVLLMTSLVISAIELSIPKFIQYFIDEVIPTNNEKLFIQLLLMLFLLIVVMLGSMAMKEYLQKTVQEKAARDLQLTLFKSLRLLGFSYHEKTPVGETLSLFNTEVTAVKKIYEFYFPQILEKTFILIITSVFMLTMNYKIFFLIIPCFLSYYTIGPYFERKAMEWLKVARENRITSNKKIYDSITSILETRILNGQKWAMNSLLSSLRKFHDSHLSANLYAFLRGTVRRLTIYLGALIFFILSAKSIQNGTLTIGKFVALTFYYYRLMTDLTHLVTSLTEQRIIMLQAERLYNFAHLEPKVKEPIAPQKIEKIQGAIELHNVSFGYLKERPLLKDININIKPGEKVAIVGSSGNGKSTLLKLITRFYDPDQGHISLDGVNLKELSFSTIRGSIGYVFQETYLFGFSVRENIRFGYPEASNEDIVKAAKAANAHDFIMNLPNGYDTLLGERGVKLSGGQRQRIAIARMFIKNPSILLLDEATSALDNENEKDVVNALDSLLKNRTTIAIAHRLSSVKNYDRIILIDNQTNLEEGSYDDLISKKGAFYKLAVGGQ